MTVALLDTSILIALGQTVETTPDLSTFTETFVSSLSYAEVRLGLYTVDSAEHTRRQDRLERLITIFGEGLPFDDLAALSYGRIVRTAVAAGQSPRSNMLDRMIAAVAASRNLTLVTRNASDLRGLESILPIVAA